MANQGPVTESEVLRIELSIEEDDFLAYQLYVASTSERIKKNRRKSRTIIPLLYLAFSILLFFMDDRTTMGIVFFSIAVIWYLGYPYYTAWKYKRHYHAFIREHYQRRFGEKAVLMFESGRIYSQDAASEGWVNVTELDEIVEISSHLFLKLKSGMGFILPKQRIKEQEVLIPYLRKLTNRLQIPYHQELGWKWA